MEQISKDFENIDPAEEWAEARRANRQQWRNLVRELERHKTAEKPFSPLAGDLERIGETELLRRAMHELNEELPEEARVNSFEWACL